MIYLKTKQQVILKHRDGISNRQIAKDLGIDKNIVNKYVNEYDQKVRELMERDPTADSSLLIEVILEAPSYDTSSRHRKPSTEEAIEKIRYCLAWACVQFRPEMLGHHQRLWIIADLILALWIVLNTVYQDWALLTHAPATKVGQF